MASCTVASGRRKRQRNIGLVGALVPKSLDYSPISRFQSCQPVLVALVLCSTLMDIPADYCSAAVGCVSASYCVPVSSNSAVSLRLLPSSAGPLPLQDWIALELSVAPHCDALSTAERAASLRSTLVECYLEVTPTPPHPSPTLHLATAPMYVQQYQQAVPTAPFPPISQSLMSFARCRYHHLDPDVAPVSLSDMHVACKLTVWPG